MDWRSILRKLVLSHDNEVGWCATGSASVFLQQGTHLTIALAEPVAHENQAVTMH